MKAKYGYVIEPHFNKVRVEIHKNIIVSNEDYKMFLIDKSFGSIFRKPIEKDYLRAKKWADEQIELINKSNK